MSEKLLIEEAKRKEEVFRRLNHYLKKLKKTVSEMDPSGRAFLFGSAMRGEYALTSDVDVLILTNLKPAKVIARLREEGFDEPFEFHVVNEREFETYKCFVRELREI